MIEKIRSLIFRNSNLINKKEEKKDNSYIEFVKRCIENYEHERKITDIPELYKCLMVEEEELYTKIVKFICEFIEKIEVDKLVYLDKIFRERTSIEWYIDWNMISTDKILKYGISEREKTIILGLSTFHPNGYFREKCIVQLSEYESNYTLPFLLIRTNDWVKNIREIALNIVMKKIEEKNFSALVNSLTVFYKLYDWKRNNNQEIIKKLEESLEDSKGVNELLDGLKNANWKIRKICYKYLLKSYIDIKIIIDKIRTDKEPFLRNFVYKEILHGEINKENREDCINYMIEDKYYRIRIELLQYLSQNNPLEYINLFRKAMIDTNSNIRDIGRKMIMKNENINFVDFYISKLKEKTIASIGGLKEVGSINEIGVVKKYLEDEREGVVKETLKFLATMDYENNKEIFQKYLEDEKGGLSNCAKKIIQERINEYDFNLMYTKLLTVNNRNVKLNFAKLLMKSDKWNSIKFIIIFLDDIDNEINQIAKLNYEAWIFNFNRSFTKPSEKQLSELNQTIVNSKYLEPKAKDELNYLIK